MEEQLRSQMRSPAFYPHRPSSVREIQTHISHVFIAPPFVYKVKKPVDFGFLNFTTLARRCFFTHRELYLNSRFSPDLYLDVLPVTYDGEDYHLSGEGDVVEYVLVMRQFDEERTMKRLIAAGALKEPMVLALARRLAAIHGRSHRVSLDRGLGTYASVRYDCQENFDQLAPFTEDFVDQACWQRVKEGTLGFLEKHRALFEGRHRSGFIRDCHGDLHTEHIIFEDENIYIFDCIEFNERFRYIDIVSDLAFLVMELAFLHQEGFISPLLDTYFSHVGDDWGPLLLDFYACYRATVRAKVNAFTAGDASVPEGQRERSKGLSRTYLDLADRLINRYTRPWLILVMGFAGTGKSTVAQALKENSGIAALRSDLLRKEMQGGHKEPSGIWNDGLYRPERRARVYERMFDMARDRLASGRSVCLDASFLGAPQRERALALSKEVGANFLSVVCTCDEERVKQYLQQRKTSGNDPSDADFSIYLKQKEAFQGWDPIPAHRRFTLDTTEGIPREELSMLSAFVV